MKWLGDKPQSGVKRKPQLNWTNKVSNPVLRIKITGKQLAILLFALESWKRVQIARGLRHKSMGPPIIHSRPSALSRSSEENGWKFQADVEIVW